jgi:hypothetical protein
VATHNQSREDKAVKDLKDFHGRAFQEIHGFRDGFETNTFTGIAIVLENVIGI